MHCPCSLYRCNGNYINSTTTLLTRTLIDLKAPQSLQDSYARDYSNHWSHDILLTGVGCALNKHFLTGH